MLGRKSFKPIEKGVTTLLGDLYEYCGPTARPNVKNGSGNRDQSASETLVEDFDAFLVERDELMRDIQHELSVQEKEKIKEIIQTDQLMAKQLTEIQNGIKADIQAIQRKKTKQLNYQNPYQPMTSDGVYYDKRK